MKTKENTAAMFASKTLACKNWTGETLESLAIAGRISTNENLLPWIALANGEPETVETFKVYLKACELLEKQIETLNNQNK